MAKRAGAARITTKLAKNHWSLGANLQNDEDILVFPHSIDGFWVQRQITESVISGIDEPTLLCVSISTGKTNVTCKSTNTSYTNFVHPLIIDECFTSRWVATLLNYQDGTTFLRVDESKGLFTSMLRPNREANIIKDSDLHDFLLLSSPLTTLASLLQTALHFCRDLETDGAPISLAGCIDTRVVSSENPPGCGQECDRPTIGNRRGRWTYEQFSRCINLSKKSTDYGAEDEAMEKPNMKWKDTTSRNESDDDDGEEGWDREAAPESGEEALVISDKTSKSAKSKADKNTQFVCLDVQVDLNTIYDVTITSEVQDYLSLLSHHESLVSELSGNFSMEIVSGTIQNRDNWLGCTYVFVQMLCSASLCVLSG
ncbi:uncharacterized protein EV420DRAFT_1642594 [Desarmillaria tabescens]|uniref:Uncharacterized protein n=1 Tax=Armillaria tabescens TaxID=1929756 RepID=A0AA39KD99_ARMTA|nr:uncharacterized protein EV420DRAFT_1642594 [Desarmillaria tabescens]KAK0458877.1 hypothetical protein EV420DRAFT_1642594 [Desarmillaria tabescens]